MSFAAARRLPAFLFEHAVAATITAAVILILAFTASWLLYERTRTIDESIRTSANLAHILDEQITRTIQAVDFSLGAMVDVFRLAPPELLDNAELTELLRGKLRRMPYVRAFCVIGPDGNVIFDTHRWSGSGGNFADREYFQAHLGTPDDRIFINPPLPSRSTGEPFVGMSRRIARADGSFGGVVLALVEPRYFTQFYESVRLSAMDSIGLFFKDGRIMLRTPDHEDKAGQSFRNSPLFTQRLPFAPLGTYRGVSVFDGEMRVLSYRTLADYPLVVVFARSERAALAAWRETAVAAAILASAVAFLLIGMTLLVRRYRAKYELAHERALRARNLEMLGHMTGGVAHDFRNFLAVIHSSIRLMRGSNDPERVQTCAKVAEDAVRQGTALTTQLTAFAKSRELDLQTADINAAVEALHPMLQQAAGALVRIELDLSGELHECVLDRAQFGSALLNLAVNARDAMPKGGAVRVSTAATRRTRTAPGSDAEIEDYVQLSLADTGPGMPPEVLRRSMEPFFTTKTDKGTGLGLNQVQRFMRMLGGEMRIDSEPGRGTTVHLLFPRARQRPAMVQRPA